MIEWENFRAFLAVARHGSYAAATRSLGMVQATVRRHIETLEARLDTPLFLRGPTGLALTAAGRDMVPLAEAMEGAALNAVRAASAPLSRLSGVVRISCFPRLAHDILPGLVMTIRRRHPDIRFEMDTSLDPERLVRGECDIGVWWGSTVPERLIATPAGTAEFVLYAHRDYLARRGVPTTLAEALTHDLVSTTDRNELRVGARRFGANLLNVKFAALCDSPAMELAMIRAGAGIGLCLSAAAARDPDLIAVRIPGVERREPVTVYRHEAQATTPRIALVCEALADLLRVTFEAVLAPEAR